MQHPQHIIIHHSLTADGDTVSWSAIRRYHIHTLGWRDVGYHYGIERIGGVWEILKGRMDDETGAHCKQAQMNRNSLGVCMVGNFDEVPPPGRMLVKLTRLVRSLMQIHNIPAEHVHPHSMFAGYKTCPGRKFPFDQFIQGLKRGAV